MKKHSLRRVATIATAAAICVGSAVMFAGCTSNNPEVTITYEFQGKEYSVDYTLSRLDAPTTVTHFLELADAGFYDGLCIHDYTSSALYSGGYKLVDGELEEVDYFAEVKRLEQEKNVTFTQSVWKSDKTTPLYTVYGEFEQNGNKPENARQNVHQQGALVMYYTDKGSFNYRVTTLRNDEGKNNNGDKYDTGKSYSYNSATSLFYTYTGYADTSLDEKYCVFGAASDYSGQFQKLLDAINDYITEHDSDEAENEFSFTEDKLVTNVNELEQGDDSDFDDLRRGNLEVTYKTPVDEPIIIKSVKVNKY